MRIGVYFGRNIFLDSRSGGAQTFQQSILQVLCKNKSRHELFIFSDDSKNEKKDSVNFVRIERYYAQDDDNFLSKILLRIPRKIKRNFLEKKFKTPLNKVVLENQIDLMWFATPAFEFVECPFIYTVWDLQHRLQGFFPEVSVSGWTFEQREQRYNFAIPRAAYVISGNQTGKEEIIKFYGMPEERVKVVPLPTPNFVLNQPETCKSFLKEFGLPSKYLFYPAQFWPHKNHIVILLALKILKEKHNLHFGVVFTGSDKGNLKYIKEKTEELRLTQDVFFLNFVSTQILIELYKNAFALVFPSFFGPDNIPPLEAFALGCPVIASKVPGSEYQLEGAALLFDPRNEEELAEQVVKLYLNSDLKNQFIAAGRQKALSWTTNNYVERIMKFSDEFELIHRCWSSKEQYKHV